MRLNRSLPALVLACALALTGCGGDDKDADTQDVSSSQKASDEAKESPSVSDSDAPSDDATAEPGSDEGAAGPAKGKQVDIDQFLDDLREGATGLTTAHMTSKSVVAGQDVTGEGDIDYHGGTPRMAMTMTLGAQGSMEMRLVDGQMYLKMPGVGDQWLQMDLAQAMSQFGMGDMLTNLDPARAFELYADGFTAATFLGEEKIAGTTTEHYQVTVDTSKIESFEDLPSQVEIPKTIDYEVWLDDEHRMRKMVMTLPGAGTTELVISDYGKKVSIAPPPPAKVQKVPSS